MNPRSTANSLRATNVIKLFHAACKSVGVRPVVVLQDLRSSASRTPEEVEHIRSSRLAVTRRMLDAKVKPTEIISHVGMGDAVTEVCGWMRKKI